MEECVLRAAEHYASCDITVADVERCGVDYAAVYAAMPECEALTVDSFRQVLYTFAPASCEKLRCA